MRASGVPERFCTGDAAPYDKFLAWAKTVPQTLRNPALSLDAPRAEAVLRHRRAAGREDTRTACWERANEALKSPQLSAKGILGKFCVKAVCTTDDPADPLTHHEAIAASGLPTKIYPTFRADRVMDPHQPEVFNPWIDKLGADGERAHRAVHGSARRAAQAPSGVSRHRRTAVRSRPRPVLRGRLHRRTRRRRSSRKLAQGQPRRRTSARPSRRT